MSADADVRAVRERPIIFSAPMVRALLGGRKTQTRRMLKPQPFIDGVGNFCAADRKGKIWNWGQNVEGTPCLRNYVPAVVPFAVGQRLWVREAWCPIASDDGSTPPRAPAGCHYRADGAHVTLDDGDGFAVINADGSERSPWRFPVHMPRWASRLTLTVTDVRVQRLQEISEEDARAEGIHPISHSDGPNHYTVDVEGGSFSAPTAASVYPMLWGFIHGPAAWDANLWVAAITFDASRPAAHADGGGRAL